MEQRLQDDGVPLRIQGESLISGQPMHDHIEIRCCSPGLNTRLNPSDNFQRALARVCLQRRPRADVVEIKSWGHDPDQDSRLTIQNKGFSENCRITVEFREPKTV